MTSTLLLGAVAYDPKVVTIWEGFRAWFAARDFDFDYLLFSNYERQVDAHLAGERDAARALMAGEVDAACMIDGSHLLFGREGTFPPGTTKVIGQTGPYDHCNFTVVGDPKVSKIDRFRALLLGMSYDDPEVRPL